MTTPHPQGPVLHVLPYDLARGAQVYARDLVGVLNSGEQSHLIVTLFEPEDSVVDAHVELGVPRGRLRRLGFDPRVVTRLRRTVGSMAPRAVVAHGGEANKYCAIALPRSIPLIYLKIGSEHPGMDRRMSRIVNDYSARRADRVVAVSNVVADELRRKHGFSSDRLTVIPNGRDADIFRPSDPRARDIPVRLIHVGYLEPGKRPELFVGIVGELKDQGLVVEATMVGGGHLDASTAALARRLGVDLVGVRDDIPELLASSDILLFVGRPPEGMPGVLIEAGLAGLPVISTLVPGASDVIVDEVTGILVDVDDRSRLVGAAKTLVEDRELRLAMGTRARERCLAEFSLEASSNLWRSLLREVGVV